MQGERDEGAKEVASVTGGCLLEPMEDEWDEGWWVGLKEVVAALLLGGAEGEEGNGVAGVDGVASRAVVEVDVPCWGVALDANGACHPSEGP